MLFKNIITANSRHNFGLIRLKRLPRRCFITSMDAKQQAEMSYFMRVTDWFKIRRYPDNEELDRRSILLNFMIYLNMALPLVMGFTHFASNQYTTARFGAAIVLAIIILLLKIPYRMGYINDTAKAAVQMRLDLERQIFENRQEEIRSEFQRRELNQACELQHSLLPQMAFSHPPYLKNSRSISAAEVGGDYFDYLPLPSGKLVVVIGDVSGHGLHSRIMMSMVKASIYSTVPYSPEITSILKTINNIARLGGMQHRMFLTLCYMILDPAAGVLSCSINGHPFPLIRKPNGSIIELGDSTYPLGIHTNPEIRVKKSENLCRR